MNERLRQLTTYIALAGAVATLALAFAAGDRSPTMLVFAAWAASPCLAIALLCRRARASRGAAVALFVAALLLPAFAIPIYVHGFFVKPDPQSGLLFVFVPLLQWAGLMPAMLLAAYLESRALRA